MPDKYGAPIPQTVSIPLPSLDSAFLSQFLQSNTGTNPDEAAKIIAGLMNRGGVQRFSLTSDQNSPISGKVPRDPSGSFGRLDLEVRDNPAFNPLEHPFVDLGPTGYGDNVGDKQLIAHFHYYNPADPPGPNAQPIGGEAQAGAGGDLGYLPNLNDTYGLPRPSGGGFDLGKFVSMVLLNPGNASLVGGGLSSLASLLSDAPATGGIPLDFGPGTALQSGFNALPPSPPSLPTLDFGPGSTLTSSLGAIPESMGTVPLDFGPGTTLQPGGTSPISPLSRLGKILSDLLQVAPSAIAAPGLLQSQARPFTPTSRMSQGPATIFPDTPSPALPFFAMQPFASSPQVQSVLNRIPQDDRLGILMKLLQTQGVTANG